MQPGSFSSLPDMQCHTESNYRMDGSLALDHNVGLCPSDAVAGEGNCSHPSNTDCGCSTGCVYSTNCGYYTNYYVHPRRTVLHRPAIPRIQQNTSHPSGSECF